MTKYAIEDGLQIPAPNTGGRPEDPCLQTIRAQVAQGVELNEAIEAAIPKYIERGSENWHQRKKDIKKRLSNKNKDLPKK